LKTYKRATSEGIAKTSSGYAPYGTRIQGLKIMRANTPLSVQVKVASGVRQFNDALEMRSVGVTRFGCTTTSAMIQETREWEGRDELVDKKKSMIYH